ncbi:MAG: gamma-glutamyltransferase [Nocardioidaceae bacterium]|nr:gamma-glutamyltransferase [Nocardioidaceae bacterium]
MSSRAVAVAAPSEAAAEAGREMTAAGGNAVDAALAASLVTMVNEPGIVSLGSGCFVTVQPSDGGAAVTIDGWAEMPGRGLAPQRFGQSTWQISTEYGGGVTMTIGPGSVAVPGTVAAFAAAHEQWGCVAWRDVFAPAISIARGGFKLGVASRYYLEFVHDLVYGWDEASSAVLHEADGGLVPPGQDIHLADLVDTLETLADQGPEVFYRGDIAAAMAADVLERGGILTREDLAAYRPETRTALPARVGDWLMATNPPPSIGGATVAAMLRLLDGHPRGSWTRDDTRLLVDVQHKILLHRVRHLEATDELDSEVRRLLDLTEAADSKQVWSPSTTHVSAADTEGTACAVTVSSGYGSGMLAAGTGVWLNNCLGEPELNARGLHGLPPGTRLISNMAPSVARRADGAVLALGSPGADRITTAIVQAMAGIAGGMSLQEAIDHPRAHVRINRSDPALAAVLDFELGFPMPEDMPLPTYEMPLHSMYFGGVTAAAYEPTGGLAAAADPRRTGAVAIGGV